MSPIGTESGPEKKPEMTMEELPVPTHEELKRRDIRDWDMDPSIAAQSKEVRAILQDAIKELPETYRAVVVLRDIMGLELSIDETHIVSVSQMVESFSGKLVASNAPILGADVFTQTAGIHADGDHKGDLYVSKLQPERFARKRVYALGKMSGKASLSRTSTHSASLCLKKTSKRYYTAL